ncbi:MAG: class II aldolase/adducin family protein, partial [Candidatus Binatia bacterium]
MDIDELKRDIVTASHILHQQGIAAAFGHVSARIPGTNTFIFPPRMSPALVRLDNLLTLDVDGNQLSGEGRPN